MEDPLSTKWIGTRWKKTIQVPEQYDVNNPKASNRVDLMRGPMRDIDIIIEITGFTVGWLDYRYEPPAVLDHAQVMYTNKMWIDGVESSFPGSWIPDTQGYTQME